VEYVGNHYPSNLHSTGLENIDTSAIHVNQVGPDSLKAHFRRLMLFLGLRIVCGRPQVPKIYPLQGNFGHTCSQGRDTFGRGLSLKQQYEISFDSAI
jgi:hypothetical protein